MPCRTDYMEDPRPNMDNYIERTKHNQVVAELDLTTRMLCDIMSSRKPVFTRDTLLETIDGLPNWWEKHKEQDRKRVEKELAERFKYLSNEEIQAIEKILDGRDKKIRDGEA